MSHPPFESGSLFPDAVATAAEEEGLLCLEGVLEGVTYHNDENAFTVARFSLGSKQSVTVLGNFINPVPGESMQLWGRWETHRQYGPQFRVERYQLKKPATAAAIEKYLGGGLLRNIGPGTAKLLVRYFGTDTITVIEKHPERLTEVPGIGAKKAKMIVEAWEEYHEIHNIMLFLQGHGISAAYATKIYRAYGDRAIEMVEKNPYQLARDIFGIGFKLADRIARTLGMAADTPERLEAGVLYCLQQASEQGHCFMPEELLMRGATELLGLPADDTPLAGDAPGEKAIGDAVERLVRIQLLVRDPDDTVVNPIYLKSTYGTEVQLARYLRKLVETPLHSPWLPEDSEAYTDTLCAELGVTLAARQREAVLSALRSRALILTGGPGTGKTTTTRAILHALLRCQRKVQLASPTGRAAKRLAEVTGCPAQTIHRLLEVDPKKFTFKRNAQNPLDCDTLIVDETSMVDVSLAYSLIRALPEGAQLILVGDADQLPSVGPGNVLRDLIASGTMPVVRLTEVFRQAAESTIITNAHKVNNGEMPDLMPTSHWKTADCLFIPQDDPLVAAPKVCDVVARSLAALGYRREEVQVLTPMQRGTLGAQHLNTLLQAALNPAQLGVAEFTRGAKTLRCGDRVIQTVNNYEKEVFNGDIGYIAHIDAEEKQFIVSYPEKDVPYDFNDTDEIQLAYALTVHKSQGSEYPAVVVVLHTQHYLLLQRNLLYTALTRAKKLAILLGSKRALAMAVRNVNRLERYTRLAERLKEEDNDEERQGEWEL